MHSINVLHCQHVVNPRVTPLLTDHRDALSCSLLAQLHELWARVAGSNQVNTMCQALLQSKEMHI